ncbi:hypothetical protein [Kibdelosporangium phytohabitans]|nr:hypothetical protein [Kibdelosporangium phytohabitans]
MSPDMRYVEVFLSGPVKNYQGRRTYHESCNRGVFGPAMPFNRAATDYVTRSACRCRPSVHACTGREQLGTGGGVVHPAGHSAGQNSSTGVIPRSLTVDVSFDGGQTWKAATVVANTLAVVQHPNDAATVSLRSKASDRADDTVEETILNAYKLN